MNIALGEQYRTREGGLMGIFRIVPGRREFSVLCMDSKQRLIQYTTKGRYIGDGYDHALDLVEKL